MEILVKHVRFSTGFVALFLAITLTVTAAQESTSQSSAPGPPVGHATENVGGAYCVGGHVKPPQPLHDPDPDYTDIARRVGYGGTVILWLVVDADGLPRNIRLQQGIGMGLDEQAIEAVKKWRFKPGTKDGQPVPVMINVEVTFHPPHLGGYRALHSSPESEATPPQFPGADTRQYPLVISIRDATGVPAGNGFEIRAAASIGEGGSAQPFLTFCSPNNSNCAFPGAGHYPARWLDGSQHLEILGLINSSKGKWEKAQYTVGAALPAPNAP